MATPKFIRRINASPEGNAKYRVHHDGYNSTLFEITSDGEIRIISGPEIAARPDEREKAELIQLFPDLQKEQKPLWTLAPFSPYTAEGKPDPRGFEGDHHYYRNEKGECGLVVQRLSPTPENSLKEKRCLPWIPIEGGRWIQQEYPGLRPLYGEYWARKRIMIHEGEKSVDAAVRAASDPTHPWRDWLGKFAHVSWRGGAIYGSPGKAEWSSIPDECQVFLLPDNDQPGFDAMRHVAKYLGHVESVVMAEYHGTPLSINGHTAPGLKGWDIADGIPPGLEDFTILENSAMLAEPIQELHVSINSKGEPVENWIPRDEFCKKIIHCLNLGIYYVREPHRIRGPFDSRQKLIEAYQHLAARPERLNLLWNNSHIRRVDLPGYRPEIRLNKFGEVLDPPAFHALPHGRIFNTYRLPRRQLSRPGGYRALHTSTRPVWDLLKHLIPDPIQRKTFIRWASLVIVGQKPMWATLLVSETQGTGKSTLLNLLGAIVGRDNFVSVKTDILQKEFNGWAEGSQLALCHELKEDGRDAWSIAEKLKSVITEEMISVRKMNTDPYTGENSCNVIAASNHVDCMRITDQDRRWYIPRVAEVILPSEIADQIKRLPDDREAFGVLLWAVYNYGLKLKAQRWLLANPQAPKFGNKSLLIENTRGPIQDLLIDEYLETAEGDYVAILVGDVQSLLEERRGPKWSPKKIAQATVSMGFANGNPPGLRTVSLPRHTGSLTGTERVTLLVRGEVPPRVEPETNLEWLFRVCHLRSVEWNKYRDLYEGKMKQEGADSVI